MNLKVLKISNNDMHKRFEDICRELFLKKYQLKYINSFHNQQAIESLPVTFEGVGYAYQCKFVDDKNSIKIDELKKGIDYLVSIKDEMPVNHITYYLGFTPGETKDSVFPEFQSTINKYANDNGIQTEWIYANQIESQLEDIENIGICRKYINPLVKNYSIESYQEHIAKSDLENYIDRNILWKNSSIDMIEVINTEKLIYLISDAGVGKTTFIKNLCKVLNAKNWHSKIIYLSGYYGQDIKDIFDTVFFSNMHQLIVFDGFDELNPTLIDKFHTLIDQIQNVEPSVRIVITSRKNYFIYSNKIDKLTVAFLEPLESQDVLKYVENRVGSDNIFYSNLLTKEIDEYLFIPFFLKNTVDLFEKGIMKSKISDILAELLILCLSTIDYNKRETVLDFLKKTALDLVEHNTIYLSVSKIPNSIREEIVRFPWVFYNKEKDSISFSHNNHKEFLAAKELTKYNALELLDHITVALLNENYLKPKYSNILPYLIDFDIEIDLLSVLLKKGIPATLKYELNFLNEDKKLMHFIGVTQKAISRKTWFDTSQIDFKDLSNLVMNKKGIEYLIDHLTDNSHRTVYHLYLKVIQEFSDDFKKTNFHLRDHIVNIAIKKYDDDGFINRIAIDALTGFPISSEDISKIIEANIYKKDSSLRAKVYDFILRRGLSNQYVSLFTQMIGSIQNGVRSMTGSYDLTEGLYFKKCIEQLNSHETILSMGKFLINRRDDSYTKDYLNSMLKCIGSQELLGINSEMLDLLHEIIKKQRFIHRDLDIENIQKILNMKNNREVLFRKIIQSELVYDDILVLAYIVDCNMFHQAIGVFSQYDKYHHFSTVLANSVKSIRNELQLIKTIEPYLQKDEKPVEQNETEQDLFNKLFQVGYTKNAILSIFDFLAKDEITFEEIILHHELKVDHDIKMIFHNTDNYVFLRSNVEKWDFQEITNNCIIHKIISNNIVINNNQAITIEKMMGNYALPQFGMLKQSSVSSSINYNLLFSGIFLYKYGIKHPDEKLYEKLLTIDIYIQDSHTEVDLSFFEKWLESETILKESKKLINEDYFKNRYSLGKRIEYLTKYRYNGVENYLVDLVLSKEKRTDLYDTKKSIVVYLDAVNKMDLIIKNIHLLDQETYEYLLEVIELSGNCSKYEAILLEELDKDNFDRAAITYKFLLNNSQISIEDKFMDWRRKLSENQVFNDELKLGIYKGIKKLENLLVLLDFEFEQYNIEKMNKGIQVVINKIGTYFINVYDRELFEAELSKFVLMLSESKHVISSYYFTYVDTFILDYLKRI